MWEMQIYIWLGATIEPTGCWALLYIQLIQWILFIGPFSVRNAYLYLTGCQHKAHWVLSTIVRINHAINGNLVFISYFSVLNVNLYMTGCHHTAHWVLRNIKMIIVMQLMVFKCRPINGYQHTGPLGAEHYGTYKLCN